ncbi:MAG TPA: hypothetical protein VNZ86_04770 [Bacteroidia bacterium]|jgi:hypothetical protein|nr:hypothetical protein [Bacteroidia bacterium]
MRILLLFVFCCFCGLNPSEAQNVLAPPSRPALADSQIVHMEAFRKASLSEKRTLLINWAQQEVIPILGAYETKVDEKFAGVRYMGDLLHKLSIQGSSAFPVSVGKVCDSTSSYWRGVMEMSPGNELIPLSKTMLYVANGEFDMAKQMAELLRPFATDKSIATMYIQELSWRLEEFNKELNGRMQRGLELHDAGNYSGALVVYKGINNDYPNSAWVHYEIYYSGNTKDMSEKKDSLESLANWDKSSPLIYHYNPMYPVQARASGGKEGYQMYRRLSQATLFKDKTKFPPDLVTLGDIALDLQAYGYAGEIYWLCFSRIKKEELKGKEMLPWFLYTLDKCSIKDLQSNFKGNFEKEFRKIDKQRKKEMEGSAVYRSFKNK